MTRSVRPAGLLLALTAAALCACAATPDPDGRLANGRRIAERDCGGCHATGPRPHRGASPDAPAFARLGSRFDMESVTRALSQGMLTGHPRMPLIKLDADELADLTAYLKSIQASQP